MSSAGGDFNSPTLVYENKDLRSVTACSDGSIYILQKDIQVIGNQINGELGLGGNYIGT